MKVAVFAIVGALIAAFALACGGDKPPMVPDSENTTTLDSGAGSDSR